jgi:serine/threonine protein phosphatase PrpC
MNIRYEMISETGLKRKVNQDRICAHTSGSSALFAVADGMGGHSEGEYASEMVIASLEKVTEDISHSDTSFGSRIDIIISALDNVNAEILEYAHQKGIICGSTVSVLFICGELFAVINVGDSPVYYADKKSACHASTEHSYDVMMKKSALDPGLEPDEHRKGRLVQAVGVKERIFPSVKTGKLSDVQSFLLCSDGVSRYFTDKKIFKALRQVSRGKISPKELILSLKEQVYRFGAADNLSAIAVLAENEECTKAKKGRSMIGWIIFAIVLVFIAWSVTNFVIIN